MTARLTTRAVEKIMTKRIQPRLSRRGFLFGGAAALVLAAPLGRLGRFGGPRVAWASPGITLDPTIDPLAQGYETDGDESYGTGARLIINDTSSGGHRLFYKAEAAIATSAVAVDVIVQVPLANVILNGIDTGVRAVLGEGAGGVEVAAALIARGGNLGRVALVTNGGGFSLGVPFNWNAEGTFRLERNPDPARRAVLTVPGQTPEVLTDLDLPPARRANASFEFGCASDPARAVASFGPIGIVIMPFAAFAPEVEIDMGPPGANQGEFEVKGSFTLGAGSDGIDILAEIVSLELTGGTGGFAIAVPAGSFRVDKKGRFTFEAVIDGGVFEMVIKPLGGGSLLFKAEGKGFDLGAMANPVDVSLTIGNDGDGAEVTAEFE